MTTQWFFRNTISDVFATQNGEVSSLFGPTLETRLLDSERGAAAVTYITDTVASGTAVQVTENTSNDDRQYWYSPPLEAATISGAITIALRFWESANSANVRPRVRIEHCDHDGNVIGTIVDKTHASEASTTSEASMTISATAVEVTDTTLAAGDRLRVTVFAANNGTMGGGQTFSFSFNGTSGGNGDSSITFTESLVESLIDLPYLQEFTSVENESLRGFETKFDMMLVAGDADVFVHDFGSELFVQRNNDGFPWYTMAHRRERIDPTLDVYVECDVWASWGAGFDVPPIIGWLMLIPRSPYRLSENVPHVRIQMEKVAGEWVFEAQLWDDGAEQASIALPSILGDLESDAPSVKLGILIQPDGDDLLSTGYVDRVPFGSYLGGNPTKGTVAVGEPEWTGGTPHTNFWLDNLYIAGEVPPPLQGWRVGSVAIG